MDIGEAWGIFDEMSSLQRVERRLRSLLDQDLGPSCSQVAGFMQMEGESISPETAAGIRALLRVELEARRTVIMASLKESGIQ